MITKSELKMNLKKSFKKQEEFESEFMKDMKNNHLFNNKKYRVAI
jgi:hypothetical protein